MRRAPVRGWWALPVAAGLTFLVPAPAQPPGPAPGGKAGQPAPPRSAAPAPPRSAAPAPMDEESIRLAELNVGLGWLADPLTFPCQLAAHVNAGAVEIRGFVPNEAVRARAVKVAREQSGLGVVNHLKLRPVATPVWRRPPEELHAATQLALKKGFPKLAPNINVLCRPFGQVILTGHVESMEEKLALSQGLRRVPGCSSVLNQLAVGFTTTTAGATTKPAPTPAAAPKALPTVSLAPELMTGPVLPRPQTIQSPLLPRFQEESPYSQLATPASKGVVAAGPVLPDVQAVSPYRPLLTPSRSVQPLHKAEVPAASEEGAASPSPYAASTLAPPATSKAYTASVPPAPAPKAYSASASPVPAASKAYTASWATSAPKPAAPAPLPLPPGVKDGPAQAAQAPSGWAPAKPANVPASTQMVQTSYRPEGVVQKAAQSSTQAAETSPRPLVRDTETQAVKSAPAPTVVARASVPPPGEPYMARGLLILGDVAATPAARPTPAAQPGDVWAKRQALLKHAIQATCGPAVHDVEVELRSSTEALVRFRAANKAEADRIWSDIQRVPELAPYKLDAVVKTP